MISTILLNVICKGGGGSNIQRKQYYFRGVHKEQWEQNFLKQEYNTDQDHNL